MMGISVFAQKTLNKTDQKLQPLPTGNTADTSSKNSKSTADNGPKATIDMYKVITLERDTTAIDTSLTIYKDYIFNYLRKDNFGLLPFANDGQTYNTLQYSLKAYSPYPEFGFRAKHFNYLEVNDIRYFSVPTPLTELYFKTVQEQGQSLDAFITLNTHERLNFSIAYKGLRSLGKYVNQLASTGNFRFTANYVTKSGRYVLNAHFTGQDLLNQENGGIINTQDFESGNDDFKDRARLEVYLKDAESFLKGNRYFIDHAFRINQNDNENNLYLTHQFNFENKIFEFREPTVSDRFGDSYVATGINDKTSYSRLYNKVGAIYENKTLGQIGFYLDDFNYNYHYNTIIVNSAGIVPSQIKDGINTFGAQYAYRKKSWKGKALYSNSITNQGLSNIDISLSWQPDDYNTVSFRVQKMNKLPDVNYNLYQSSYVAYNWSNDFKNEKINNLIVKADTQWAAAELQLSVFKDQLYYSNDSADPKVLLVSPKQYGNTINYLSLKVSKEIQYGRFALDNTLLYQKTAQDDDVLNVPQLVTRNTLYYSGYFFKKAMFVQTGFTFSYFTKYFANDYNPVLGEFYVQNQKEIGNFPMVDFFVNARVRQTRIYLKAEHFNSAMTGNDFYSAPNYPYRDFVIRFGLVWNFFQ
ncbi:putative porin [Flavobacterium pallidum]|nr:putative porin [Flavobacterium pallidum]